MIWPLPPFRWDLGFLFNEFLEMAVEIAGSHHNFTQAFQLAAMGERGKK